MAGKQRVTIDMPYDLYEALKAEAHRRGISMNALAVEKLAAEAQEAPAT